MSKSQNRWVLGIAAILLVVGVNARPGFAQEDLRKQSAKISSGLSAENAARFAILLKQEWNPKPEWAEMLTAILEGKPMGPNSGWFKPSQTRLGWTWFAKQFDVNGNGKVSREEGKKFAKVYEAIDRDGDGSITSADFNWNDVSHVIPTKPSQAMFFMLDRDSNGRLDEAEILQWMARLDQSGKGFVTPDEFENGMATLDQLKDQLKPAAESKKKSATESNRMMNMLFQGQLGTMTEGPAIGEVAPDFELPQLKGNGTTQLSTHRDQKIVVLNFGSFT